MSKICPKCGASSKDRKFIGPFCSVCYAEMNRPELPDEIIIYKCRDCGAEKYKVWNEEDIKASIARSLYDRRFGIPKIKLHDNEARLNFAGLDDEFVIPVIVKDSLCGSCAQRHSGYYEGIIQLRGRYAHDERFINSLISRLEKSTFIQRVEQLKDGIDIYYGDKEITRSILSSMNVKVKVSNKLWGVKDGRRVYRTTFLIRE